MPQWNPSTKAEAQYILAALALMARANVEKRKLGPDERDKVIAALRAIRRNARPFP